MFRVDRMKEVDIDDHPGAFQRPSAFRIADALRDLPWETGSEGTTEAEVRFGHEVAWWAARQLGGRVKAPEDDGALVVTIPVANREAFISWVLSFGDSAEVLRPPVLRQAIVERVRESG
jgi:predicted DNA-binding transcriptional regulator YafY